MVYYVCNYSNLEQLVFWFFNVLQIVEDCENRFGDDVDELAKMVAEVLPPAPTEPASEEVSNEADEKTADQNSNEQLVGEGPEKAPDKETS